MIGDGYFDKGEEEHFQERMNNVDKRMQNLLEQSQRDQEKWVKSLHRHLVYSTSIFSVKLFVNIVAQLAGFALFYRIIAFFRLLKRIGK